ncbi:hypothetical protein CRM22_002035 [Opisthorchis felineus]|uniref:Uncharacterized protein n=1 Tax=Opisthorchis felineus TaxID=147828 RepID=A0A4S2M7X7_OPIFE|nr:hypothetical protein CRM22_002035 [Opisthorchis felineus]
MINRVHVDEIRRRRSVQNCRKLVNETFHGDRSVPHQEARRNLNASLNVARHITLLGQSTSHPAQRLSLPVKPTGQKESKVVHRKDLHLKSATGTRPTNNSTFDQTTKNQAHRQLVPIPKPIRNTKPSGTDTFRLDDCHHLCLPDWIVQELRSIWTHFEKPPPPLTKQAADNPPEISYAFPAVRNRLREEKAKMNVDLDAMFARLGLDVSELRREETTKEKVSNDTHYVGENASPKSLAISPTPAGTKNTLQVGAQSDNTRSPDKSPTRKRMRRVLEYLTKNTGTPPSISGILDITNSLSTSPPAASTSSTNIPGKIGLDMIALKLCNIQSNIPPLPPLDHIQKRVKWRPEKDSTKYPKLMNPSRYAESDVAEFQRKLAAGRLKQREIDCDTEAGFRRNLPAYDHALDDRLSRVKDAISSGARYALSKIRSQMNRSLQEDMAAICTWWDLPSELRQNPSLYTEETQVCDQDMRDHRNRLDHCRTEVVTPPNLDRGITVPMHPMWDTPEELRTSVNLSLFRM